MSDQCRHDLSFSECAVCKPATPSIASSGLRERRPWGDLSGIKITRGVLQEPTEYEKEKRKKKRRQDRQEFIEELERSGLSIELLFQAARFLEITQPSGKPFKIEAQIPDFYLNKHSWDLPLAVSECQGVIYELVDKIEADTEWERFIYQLAGNRFVYYKPLRKELLSILGSKEMRSLFANNLKKFNSNRLIIEKSSQRAYDSWYLEFQKRQSESMDREVAKLDLERKIPIRNVNGLPLEFMHPQDLVLLDLPEPRKPSSYRFPLHGS